MRNCISFPPLRTVTEKCIYIIFPVKRRKDIAVVERGECYGNRCFFLKRPVLLIYPKADAIITRFVIMVHLRNDRFFERIRSSETPCLQRILSEKE